jgi:hypothetical protein
LVEKPFEGSTSACMESKRSTGGARGHLQEIWSSLSGQDELLTMVEIRPGIVNEVRGTPSPLSILDAASAVGPQCSELIKPAQEAVKRLLRKGHYKYTGGLEAVPETAAYPPQTLLPSDLPIIPKVRLGIEPLTVGVAAVLEPLKVRLITKGESSSYWLVRGVQKALWEHLNSLPQFCPIGRPLCVLDFYRLLQRSRPRVSRTSTVCQD